MKSECSAAVWWFCGALCWAFDLPIPLVCGSPLSFTASLDISYYAPRPLPRCYSYVGQLEHFCITVSFSLHIIYCIIYYIPHSRLDTETNTNAIFVKSEKFHNNSRQYDKTWSHAGVLSIDLYSAAILGPFQALWSASGVLGPFPRRQSPFLINLAGDQNITKRHTRQNPSLSLCPRVVGVNKVASPISTYIPTYLAPLTSVILYVCTWPFLYDSKGKTSQKNTLLLKLILTLFWQCLR